MCTINISDISLLNFKSISIVVDTKSKPNNGQTNIGNNKNSQNNPLSQSSHNEGMTCIM